MDLAFYESLPDYLDPTEIERYCLEILASSEVDGVDNVRQKLDVLGDHQWHSYEEPSVSLKHTLEEWMQRNWDASSQDFITGCLGIGYCFALSRALYEKALSQYEGEFIDEFRANLSHSSGEFIDPFWSLRT